MIPGVEMLACADLAVPVEVMQHVVNVESSFNPYAIGVVGAQLARQPRSLDEAVATAAELEREGFNFSLGLAQVNRHNLAAHGLDSYEQAFAICPNLAAGARILANCRGRAGGDWGKALSCYYSGNFERGFRDGYVQKVRASMQAAGYDVVRPAQPIPVRLTATRAPVHFPAASLRERRGKSSTSAAVAPAKEMITAREQAGPAHAGPVATSPGNAPFVPTVTGPGQPSARPPDHGAGPHAHPHAQDQADSAFVF